MQPCRKEQQTQKNKCIDTGRVLKKQRTELERRRGVAVMHDENHNGSLEPLLVATGDNGGYGRIQAVTAVGELGIKKMDKEAKKMRGQTESKKRKGPSDCTTTDSAGSGSISCRAKWHCGQHKSRGICNAFCR
eukprot:TRINITY_DN93188_c0_g1_i1.p3 TRINITY_DN93188_c0_g1~~TRINITY_DN93188_c0_g1_i1.p3  ORF type:complete len:133 (+),score=26.46 TRINITY_DN93188_c0_g1_i1:1141-1539(+)